MEPSSPDSSGHCLVLDLSEIGLTLEEDLGLGRPVKPSRRVVFFRNDLYILRRAHTFLARVQMPFMLGGAKVKLWLSSVNTRNGLNPERSPMISCQKLKHLNPGKAGWTLQVIN